MEPGEFTRALAQAKLGDEESEARLVAIVYGDLQRLARRHLGSRRFLSTLNTSSLINESYLRLVNVTAQQVETRAHFMNLASRIMRQVVCDYARQRLRTASRIDKNVTDEEAAARLDAEYAHARELEAIDEALKDLALINERQARVVECRFFAGLNDAETAEVLGISVRTVWRDWETAKTWLKNVLAER